MGILLPRAQAQRGLGTAVGREKRPLIYGMTWLRSRSFFFVSMLVLYVLTEELL